MNWIRVCIAILLFAVSSPSLLSQQPSQQPGLWLGTAWYPEQWPDERWDADLALMEKAGMRFVRVGEFAWSRMEPAEGRFDLEWLDRAITLAAKHHIYTALGTPTAAPPAWLTSKYPDTVRTNQEGRQEQHGNRQHFRFTSARYRDFCKRIAGEMARRFGKNPNVIGWQIDNEYATYSYDDETRRDFQQWLQRKYGTLENLNQRWTTAYWSQTYSAWDQIPIPIGNHNPSLMLEWKRFVSDVYRSYQKDQITAIRQHAEPRQWITHNFMGWFDGFDHYTVSADLNFASWDNYAGNKHLDPWGNGMIHDLTRGFLRKNFWVMETQPDHVNWADVNVSLDRGEGREMAWLGIAHGADAIGYWQWRSALGGQEQYHGTLVGPDGMPVPVYDEIAQLGRDFAKVGDLLRGTAPVAQVAMLHSYDDRWAVEFQRHHKDFSVRPHFEQYYKPLRRAIDTIDVVNPAAPLDGYKLVVAPNLHLISEAEARHLFAFVEAGGHLVVGARSGMKDEYNALWPARQPGPLAKALGAHVAQYYALDKPVPVGGDFGTGEAKILAEWLVPDAPDVKVLARYGRSNGWLDEQPAIVSRAVGKGRITYVGAMLDDAQAAAFAKWALETSGVTPSFAAPQDVSVSRRSGAGKDVWIVINHSRQAQKITLPSAMREHLKGSTPVTTLELAPRDVAVLTK